MMPPDTISPQTPNPPPKTDYLSQTHIHSHNNNPTNLPLIHPCDTPSLYGSLNSFDVINLYRIFAWRRLCNPKHIVSDSEDGHILNSRKLNPTLDAFSTISRE